MAIIDFTHGKGRRLPATLLGILAIVALLALPSLAAAQDTSAAGSSGAFDVGKGQPGGTGSTDIASSPTGDQYNDSFKKINSFTAAGSDPSGSGGLPFTGFDVGLVALIGVALLGSGLFIRRLGRDRIDA